MYKLIESTTAKRKSVSVLFYENYKNKIDNLNLAFNYQSD